MEATTQHGTGTTRILNASSSPRSRSARRIEELARKVAADYGHVESVLLVCILKGAVMFMADFSRALGQEGLAVELEFMAISSYGQRSSSSGVVRIMKDLDRDIAGRHVIVVEDIVDSGLTLSWLLKYLESRTAASVEVVALLRKPDAIRVQVPVKYVGFDIPTGVRRRVRARLRGALPRAAVRRAFCGRRSIRGCDLAARRAASVGAVRAKRTRVIGAYVRYVACGSPRHSGLRCTFK